MAKFKKGDRCEVVQEIGRFNKGEVVTVDQDFSSIPWVLREGGERKWVSQSSLRLIKETETETASAFSVGDIVKIKDSCSGCIANQVTTLVRGDDGDLWALTSDEVKGCSCTSNWELTTEKVPRESVPVIKMINDGGMIRSYGFGSHYQMFNDEVGEFNGFKTYQTMPKETLTNKIKNTMGQVNMMMKKLLDPKTQLLIKHGYINGDLQPTMKAIEVIDALQFDQFKDDLVALAEEDEKESKKK